MNIKDNTYWNNHISKQEIYERKFSIARLLFTNEHIPLIAELKEKVLSTYKVKAKFIFLGYNGDNLICNGQTLVSAKNKRDKNISLGKNVSYIDGNLTPQGSNKYPRIANNTSNYCILEFISFGLPYVDNINGWDIELLNIEKI